MFVLVHGVSEVLSVKSGEVLLGGDVLAILRACPRSLSLLWRKVFDRAVTPVLLVNSAFDMQSGM